MTVGTQPSELHQADGYAAAARYGILDTPPEPVFDDIVKVAAAVCNAPMAFLSFLDHDRQWFKARLGIGIAEMPLARSACRFAVEQRRLLVISDLRGDPRTQADGLVTGEPGLRFYAGAPIVDASGAVVGTLCVLDTAPRPDGLNDTQVLVLETLARQAVAHLESRRLLVDSRQVPRGHVPPLSLKASGGDNKAESTGVFDIDIPTGVVSASESMCRMFGLQVAPAYPASAFEERILPDDRGTESTDSTRADGSAPTNVVYRVRMDDGAVKWIARNAVFEYDDSGRPVRMLGTVQDVTEQKKAAIRKEALIVLGDRLRALDDIESMVIVASDLMARTLDAIRAGFGIVDPVEETVTVRSEWRAPGVASVAGVHHFRQYGSYIDQLKAGTTVVILDVSEDPRTHATADAFLSLGVRSLVNIPIMDRGKLNLVVLVHHNRPYAWSEEELAFVRSFGDRVQVAIARLQAERDQDLLNREIGHRLKNTFAMVHAIAHQTLRGVAERSLVADFSKRLAALSTAHDILLNGEHEGATVGEVVQGFARTLSVEDRVDFEGPEVALGSRGTLSLSLLLHELGTNAIKHGSLSNETGRVDVVWAVAGYGDGAEFCLRWSESGGPPAHEPERKGFGSKLISMGLIGTGGVQTHYGEDGFSAEMTANLLQLERAN
jgi:PAS domain S-box-containing protein